MEKRRNIAHTLRDQIIATTQEEIKEDGSNTNRNIGKKKKKKRVNNVQNDQNLL